MHSQLGFYPTAITVHVRVCLCKSQRVHLPLQYESLAQSAGSNPIWSRREMFHCSDATQTQGLFLLARVHLCLRCMYLWMHVCSYDVRTVSFVSFSSCWM